MIKKNLYFVLFIVTVVIGLTMLVEVVFRKPYSFHGTIINPPLPVTDFTLQTSNEEVFRLSDQKRGVVIRPTTPPGLLIFVNIHTIYFIRIIFFTSYT